ncbi:polypeptide composition of the spore coat protein CotJB [Gracilibacillus boraciitolerans JCM 21714]|uniref:Polypeptide composition of the spore coat protein CotJB n=1 Tax=Gracilibacillus boraciitolerans JCM 21714 TaxID=1298598 RepID=W4VDS0_9BACI|nr:spore coat protein CotJB [Gracilibacillus boraciitolerans]GAE91336.1 polypeptide composition of the spore coat protein CotJB [Gracilibacillus boraciitolerans JCM 21714]
MTHQKTLPDSYYQLMEQIQQVDFVLVELTLYLDTHPDDLDAINQFNQAAYESRQLKNTFEKQFGPLMQFGQSFSNYPWDWKEAPWPWQV